MIRPILQCMIAIWSVISALYLFRGLYFIIGLVRTRRFPKTQQRYKYAILVAARNEEKVIGKLIESIKQQDYPQELIDVFVVADNCTDATAAVASRSGAICYERQDDAHCTKGYALQFLVECIRRDYGIESYDGYFLFDADNLLKADYVSRMNEAFASGERIITSYRSAKNFGKNWISASYGLHWLRTIRTEHRARSVLHLATRIQGTGFLFSKELIAHGWNYVSLTEDRAFCADAVAQGYQISYQNAAVFYDEQPTDFKIAMRQRIRWAKGHLQAFAETGPKLLAHIFYTGGVANKTPEQKKDTAALRLLRNLRLRFMSFDMLTVVFPHSFASLVYRWACFFLRAILTLQGFLFGLEVAPKWVATVCAMADISVAGSGLQGVALLLLFMLAGMVSRFFGGVLIAAYIFLVEGKQIQPTPPLRKIWFCLTFPLFDLIGRISTCIALFTKAEWKPIPHDDAIGIEQMDNHEVENH